MLLDGIRVSDLRYQNMLPSWLSRPREYGDIVTLALDRHLTRIAATPDRDFLLAQFALPFGPIVRSSARRRGLAYGVYLRGDDVWIWPHTRRDGRRAFAKATRDAAVLLAVSDALLQEARRLADHDLPNGIVVANGIDLALFRPVSPEERNSARVTFGLDVCKPVVLCVGTALERKGWRELFAAMSQVGSSPPMLVAVSTGYGNLDLSKLRDEIAPQVPMAHYRDVDAMTLSRIYQAADIFCLPSHGEGMSNALLEALASGLPVVATPVGGHAEVVEPGVNGQLVQVGDVPALTAALRALLDDPVLRERMGHSARRSAEAIDSPDANGARVARLFDAVLEGIALTPDLKRSSYSRLASA
jgi:glycosyltransferase involved in cell wall biosynthesis